MAKGEKMIDTWLKAFKHAWQNQDIDAVLKLFTDDVEYWENPFKKLASKEDLRNEWDAIRDQSNIALTTAVFSEVSGRFAVTWDLSYENERYEKKHWAGTYLIVLNQAGKCTYFHQAGEEDAKFVF